MARRGSTTSGRRAKKSLDLTSSEGLLKLANIKGGEVAEEANKIATPTKTLGGKIKEFAVGSLQKTLDTVSRPNYAIASAVKNVIDKDPNTTALVGLRSGITGQTKHTFWDVFSEAGVNPTDVRGKAFKAQASLALDILTDPTTYLTFGTSAGVKVGGKTLTREGAALLAKGTELGAGKTMGADFVKQAIVNMAEKSPELYKKFIDQGGIKFFGKSIISGGRIKAVSDKLMEMEHAIIPQESKLGQALTQSRNALYSLFNRDYSAKYGKLPQELTESMQKFGDLSYIKPEDAIRSVTNIARENNLTVQEAKLISNAIETKLPIADGRLDNVRKQIQSLLGIARKQEIQAGIKVGELQNYVHHALVEAPTTQLNFKPGGVTGAKLGAAKTREIVKIVGESGETFIGNPRLYVKTSLDEILESTTGSLNKKLSEISKKADDFFEELRVRAADKVEPEIPEGLMKRGAKMDIEIENLAKSIEGKNADIAARLRELNKKNLFGRNGEYYNIKQATIDEINQAFGKEFFDENIINSTAIRLVNSSRAINAKNFYRDVTAKFGALAKEAPSNYVETGIKELSAYKFHPAVADAIKNFRKAYILDDASGALLRQFDKLQNLWKASVTQLFPAFHGRNALSNVLLNFLDIGVDSINPVKHALAVDLLSKEQKYRTLERLATGFGEGADMAKISLRELSATPVLKDNFGKQWTFGDLRTVVRENRVAFGDEFLGQLDVREKIAEKLQAATGVKSTVEKVNPLSTRNLAFKAGKAVGGAIEQQARLVNFISNLQKTGDVMTSAQRVKQFLFDYQNLSLFEKNVLKRLVPFYTFTRKNLALQASQFVRQPGKYATQAKIFNNLSRFIGGGSLTEEEKKNLPQFLRQGLGIVTKRDGKKLEIVSTLGTPMEAVFSALQKNQILGSLTPTIAVPLQLATQRSFFYDKPLDEVNDATAFKNAPEFIKDYIGFTVRKNKDGSERYVALNPTRLFIISNLPPTTRVISSIRQLEQNNVSGKLKVLQQLMGIRPYSTDLEISAATQEKQKFTKLQNLLEDAGVAPTFKRSFIPSTKPKSGSKGSSGRGRR